MQGNNLQIQSLAHQKLMKIFFINTCYQKELLNHITGTITKSQMQKKSKKKEI